MITRAGWEAVILWLPLRLQANCAVGQESRPAGSPEPWFVDADHLHCPEQPVHAGVGANRTSGGELVSTTANRVSGAGARLAPSGQRKGRWPPGPGGGADRRVCRPEHGPRA